MSNNSLLLGLTTNSDPLNFQITLISIKLERENYLLWHSIILSALTTFDLVDFALSPIPPVATISTTKAEGITTSSPNPEYTLWKKRDSFVLL